MTWLKDVIGTEKPIIAMCHFRALPGDPGYDKRGGMELVLQKAREDLDALQEGGVDAVMFSNEFSLPYQTRVDRVTVAGMARIIGELMPMIKVPYGVNALWDADASIDVAVATGAKFVREIFTGVYASDFGLWDTDCGNTARHRKNVDAENVRLLFNIVPEAANYLGGRRIEDIARSTVFNCRPDGICVSGLTAGAETDSQTLSAVKRTVPNTVVIANTGCRKDNIEHQLSVADAAIVGTTFKYDGVFDNQVDVRRVREFMDVVKAYRTSIGL